MSGQAGGGGADRGGSRHKDEPDWGMSTATSVSAFLAGFSLAAVVLIAGDAGKFRWPGVAALALTIGSVVLIVVAQASRRGAHYWVKYPGNEKKSDMYRDKWRPRLWTLYQVGVIALLAGLGAALAPRDGMGGQQVLRWLAVCVAFLAAIGEALVAFTPAERAAKRAAKWISNHWQAVRRRGG